MIRHSIKLLPIFTACLGLLATTVGAQTSPQAPPRSISDITALLDQHKPDPEKVKELQAAVKREPPAGASKEALAEFYHERAQAAELLGMVTQQISDLRQAEELLSAGSVEWERVLRSRTGAEAMSGNFASAFRVREMLLARSNTPGQV